MLTLEFARRRRRLSQADLARRAGITQSALSLVESGKRVPSLPTLQRLARAVRCRRDPLGLLAAVAGRKPKPPIPTGRRTAQPNGGERK
jgi:transcriptional regulator with XRE-family HTH domain